MPPTSASAPTAAGLLVTRLGVAMEPALLAAPLIAGLGAALFGFFIVRLSGIYLAMLTLAFAQIVYAVAFQWVEVTGGDNGVVGVWPSRWAAGREVYYYLALLVSGGGHRAAAAGHLRAVRLHAARGARFRACAPTPSASTCARIAGSPSPMAGAAAGLAGGLFAFSKGSIDPTLISIPMSVDFLVMMLLGGMQTVIGPLVGAAAFHSIRDFVMPLTDLLAAAAGARHHRHRAGVPARHRRRAWTDARGSAARDRAQAHAREGRGMSLLASRGCTNRSAAWWPRETSRSPCEAGRLLAIIGPNGAGKSTIFNMVGGQLAPDSGRVRARRPGHHRPGRRGASGVSASAAPSRWRRRSCP